MLRRPLLSAAARGTRTGPRRATTTTTMTATAARRLARALSGAPETTATTTVPAVPGASPGSASASADSRVLPLSSLTAVSPVDGRYARKTRALRHHFSEYALIKARAEVEVRWVQRVCGGGGGRKEDFKSMAPELPTLTAESNAALERLVREFSLHDAERVKEIEKTTNHDVKAVEYFLRERLQADTSTRALSPVVHFTCTSEDVSNLAYGLMLKSALDRVILPAMDEIIVALAQKAVDAADASMLSRTHGQPATPTTLGKELAVFAFRLAHHRQSVASCVVPGKFSGAVGNYAAHAEVLPDVDWPATARAFVTRDLGLAWNPYTTQIESHDGVAEVVHAVSRFNTALLSLDRDLWQYVSLGYLKQHVVEGEVGSSTMPNKVNPIDFENSEGNLGLANALFGHLAEKLPVSRMQRDLSDSTVMRALGSGFAHSLVAYESALQGLRRVDPDVAAMAKDLDGHWEVLAEPLQTVARRYGIEGMYERMKELTRGRTLGRAEYAALVADLPVPDHARGSLAKLTPARYTGYSKRLAETLVNEHLPNAQYVVAADEEDVAPAAGASVAKVAPERAAKQKPAA